MSNSVRTVHRIPTGFLFTGEYSRGMLETLSIGDYGKKHNVKADWLGYTEDLDGVANTTCMPLSEKWVVTLSTQYGCPMACTFCDVPNLGFHGNASFEDLQAQLLNAIGMFPPGQRYTERLNLHFARMGDPGYNDAVLDFTQWLWHGKRDIAATTGLTIDVLHPVFTTSSPKKVKKLPERLARWVSLKNDLYNGQAGLQLSINSTSDAQREAMFAGKAMSLADIAAMVADLPDPRGAQVLPELRARVGGVRGGRGPPGVPVQPPRPVHGQADPDPQQQRVPGQRHRDRRRVRGVHPRTRPLSVT